MTDAATRKLFAQLGELLQRMERLESLEKRLARFDTNGKLDAIEKQVKMVASNSEIVVNTVIRHSNFIAKLEKDLTRLELRCPLLKRDTAEVEKVGGGNTDDGG